MYSGRDLSKTSPVGLNAAVYRRVMCKRRPRDLVLGVCDPIRLAEMVGQLETRNRHLHCISSSALVGAAIALRNDPRRLVSTLKRSAIGEAIQELLTKTNDDGLIPQCLDLIAKEFREGNNSTKVIIRKMFGNLRMSNLENVSIYLYNEKENRLDRFSAETTPDVFVIDPLLVSLGMESSLMGYTDGGRFMPFPPLPIHADLYSGPLSPCDSYPGYRNVRHIVI